MIITHLGNSEQPREGEKNALTMSRSVFLFSHVVLQLTSRRGIRLRLQSGGEQAICGRYN